MLVLFFCSCQLHRPPRKASGRNVGMGRELGLRHLHPLHVRPGWQLQGPRHRSPLRRPRLLLCLEQDMGSTSAGPLRCHGLPRDPLPSALHWSRICSRPSQSNITCLSVLSIQSESPFSDEVPRPRVLWRQQPKADDSRQDPR